MSERLRTEPKRRFRNDLILIILLLSFAIAAGLFLYLFRGEGTEVQVTVDGETWGRYSLMEDRVVEIRTQKGVNRLVIQDGEVYVEFADCADGICADHNPISRTKESIVCLPHGVVITVRGGEDGKDVDLVT